MKYLYLVMFIFSNSVLANTPDWSAKAVLPGNKSCEMIHNHEVCTSDSNRKNIYESTETEFQKNIFEGAKHALVYPVQKTELLISYEVLRKFFESDTNSRIRKYIFKIGKKIGKFQSFTDMFDWLGLHKFPKTNSEIGPNTIPNRGTSVEREYMGVTLVHGPGGEKGLTMSCAACHSSDLFGVKVLGLTNRFPKSNRFFHLGRRVMQLTPPAVFKQIMGANENQMRMYRKARKSIRSVKVKTPLVLGLDTSLAQVGLSLAKRGTDEYATRSRKYSTIPRRNPLNNVPADSKPAVWWNLKYKTRWLSDGSIVAGNPIYTNFLWNEIGRGIDLKNLEEWMVNNQQIIKELTTFVFSTEPPKYNNFFPKRIKIEPAKRGQELFNQSCRGCHGTYVKGWNSPNADSLNYEELIATTKISYHTKTPVIDVKTDPYRYQGMNYFAKDLNRLKISKTIGTIVEPQVGYVPPPLVGIWSRWPYFHNNSAPSLCAVLTPDYLRQTVYWAMPAIDKKRDFDEDCNGYPKLVSEKWKTNKEYRFDTRIKGLSNKGHTKMLLNKNGSEKFTPKQKLDIIQYLKTL